MAYVYYTNLLNGMEVLFSVEYIISPLIIEGVFNCFFPVLLVIYVYYCIGKPLL